MTHILLSRWWLRDEQVSTDFVFSLRLHWDGEDPTKRVESSTVYCYGKKGRLFTSECPILNRFERHLDHKVGYIPKAGDSGFLFELPTLPFEWYIAIDPDCCDLNTYNPETGEFHTVTDNLTAAFVLRWIQPDGQMGGKIRPVKAVYMNNLDNACIRLRCRDEMLLNRFMASEIEPKLNKRGLISYLTALTL